VAANQPTVYIRWGMGPITSGITYPGWNIDDIQITSYAGGVRSGRAKFWGSCRTWFCW
jgi:hypothetical protein